MMKPNLTMPGGAATSARKDSTGAQMGSKAGRSKVVVGAVLATTAFLSGCINVNAPDEAIVIELNINIRQEVIYRLAEDAANTIDENADIF